MNGIQVSKIFHGCSTALLQWLLRCFELRLIYLCKLLSHVHEKYIEYEKDPYPFFSWLVWSLLVIFMIILHRILPSSSRYLGKLIICWKVYSLQWMTVWKHPRCWYLRRINANMRFGRVWGLKSIMSIMWVYSWDFPPLLTWIDKVLAWRMFKICLSIVAEIVLNYCSGCLDALSLG